MDPTAPDPSAPRERLKAARAKLRDQQRIVTAKRMERQTKILESVADYSGTMDWVSAYSDLLGRFRNEPSALQPSTTYDRRYGRDYPMFQTEQELALLRMPGRIVCSTNAYGIGLVEGLTSYIIGDGYTYKAAPKGENGDKDLAEAVQRIVDDYLARNDWYGGCSSPLEEECFQRSMEDGEFFLNHFIDGDGFTTVRTVEPEQVTQNGSPWRWEEGSFGILSPADDAQKVLAYWIFYGTNPSDGKDYPVDRIVHLKRNVKRSIKRGLTDFSFDTYDALEVASKLRRSMSLGAAIQSTIVGIRQHSTASQNQVNDFINTQMSDYAAPDQATGAMQNFARYMPGQFVDIDKGQEWLDPPGASNAEAYISVLQACLRGAGVRWQAPEWLSSASAADMAAYTASLVAESPFVRTGKRRQRAFKGAFLRSVWYAVAAYIRFRGGLTVVRRNTAADGSSVVSTGEESFTLDQVRRLVEIEVEAPTIETRDRLAEAQTNQIELTIGTTSVQTICAEQGRDYEQITRNNEEHQERTGTGPGGAMLELDPDGDDDEDDDQGGDDEGSGGGSDKPDKKTNKLPKRPGSGGATMEARLDRIEGALVGVVKLLEARK